MANQTSDTPKPNGGYGKRPLWQWVVIYLVLAAIVYAVIYFVFIRDSGSNGAGGFGY